MKSIIQAVAALAFSATLVNCGDNGVNNPCPDGNCEETCGNGVIDTGEDCDGTDLGTATCQSVAQREGQLACSTSCTFDTSSCEVPDTCGNGVIETGEDCDGAQLGTATCETAGFSSGTVACNARCELDIAGCCRDFCDTPNSSVCNDDVIETCTMQASGCLALETVDCGATGEVCDDSGAAPTCTCTDTCTGVGQGRCLGTVAESCTEQVNGCLDWQPIVDCATTSEECALQPSGSATCTSTATGEDCQSAFPLTNGDNLVAWNALNANYMTAAVSCFTSTTSFAGPDIVLSYTATVDGLVRYELEKPSANRHVIVATNASCGTITAQAELSCMAETNVPVLSDTFAVTAGSRYYFYVRDTSTGGGLASPFTLTLDESACAGLDNPTSNLTPAPGATVATSRPVISASFRYPVRANAGTVTLTGSLGTTQSFNLTTTAGRARVTFSDDGRTMTISPTVNFQPLEQVTVSWTGLIDDNCGAAIPAPTWSFTFGSPTCSPGTNGMVGTTVTRHDSGLSSFTEYYTAVDTNPNGYVYVGGLTNLYRMPKAGGSFQDVVFATSIDAAQLGYAMTIVGSRLFTLDTATSALAPFLWRLSTSGGVSWNTVGYGQYPTTAGAGANAMLHLDGRLYVVSNETTTGAATQIWSVSANAALVPEDARLEATIDGIWECDGLAGDAQYFYLACDDDYKRIVRVSRTTWQPELVTDALPLNTTKNDLIAQDLNADGRADVLYVKSDDEAVRYVCDPGAPTGPTWLDTLVDFGGATTAPGNFGLSFDPVAGVLWTLDDDTMEFVSIR